jgi:hypothetical protein
MVGEADAGAQHALDAVPVARHADRRRDVLAREEAQPAVDQRARAVPATNAALVARVAELAALAGRPLATIAQTRATLGLPAAAA